MSENAYKIDNKMISNLFDIDENKWKITTINHCKNLISNDFSILNKSDKFYGNIPIYFSIVFGSSVDVFNWIYENTGNDNIKKWEKSNNISIINLAIEYNRFEIVFKLLNLKDLIYKLDNDKIRIIEYIRDNNKKCLSYILKKYLYKNPQLYNVHNNKYTLNTYLDGIENNMIISLDRNKGMDNITYDHFNYLLHFYNFNSNKEKMDKKITILLKSIRYNSNINFIKLLHSNISGLIDINSIKIGDKKDSLLHFSCYYASKEILEFFISKKNNLFDVKNVDNFTPYDLFIKRKSLDINFLKKKNNISKNISHIIDCDNYNSCSKCNNIIEKFYFFKNYINEYKECLDLIKNVLSKRKRSNNFNDRSEIKKKIKLNLTNIKNNSSSDSSDSNSESSVDFSASTSSTESSNKISSEFNNSSRNKDKCNNIFDSNFFDDASSKWMLNKKKEPDGYDRYIDDNINGKCSNAEKKQRNKIKNKIYREEKKRKYSGFGCGHSGENESKNFGSISNN